MPETATADPNAKGIDRALMSVAIVVVLGAIMSILDTTVVNVAISHLVDDVRHVARDDPVGRHRLHARARDGDPDHRAGPPTGSAPSGCTCCRSRCSSCGSILSGLAWSAGVADRLPRPAGPRRRHAHARRHDDPDPGRRPAARRARHEHHRRADAARPDRRPDPRRLARRRRLLALDLLHQHPDRDRRARSLVPARPPARPAQARAPASTRSASRCSPPASRCSSTAWRSRAGAAASARARSSCRCSSASCCSSRSSVHALRTTDPLIDLRLFQNRTFAAASATLVLFAIAVFGSFLLLPLYFQTVRGETAMQAGLLLAPQGFGAMLVMPIAGPAHRPHGRRAHRARRPDAHARRDARR